jgi:sulfonate transport system substrate-binding protein
MRHSRFFRAVACLLLLTGAAATAEAGTQVQTLRIGWLRGPNDLTLAMARGTLEKALAARHVKLEWAGPFAAAAPALEALNAGSIDLTAGSSTSAITGLAAHIPFVIFAYQKMAPATEGILVRRGSDIHDLHGLVGKSVAVNRGGTGEYLLVRALTRSGIDPQSVRRVYLTPGDSGIAFLQGHVDAWATWDPFLSIALKNYDGRVLADGAAIGSDNAVVLIARRDLALHDPATLQFVFDALKADDAWAIAHKAEAGAIWAKAMGIPANLGPAIGANNAVPTRAVSAADIAQIEHVADWYVQNGIVPHRPDIQAGVISLKP